LGHFVYEKNKIKLKFGKNSPPKKSYKSRVNLPENSWKKFHELKNHWLGCHHIYKNMIVALWVHVSIEKHLHHSACDDRPHHLPTQGGARKRTPSR
jgi:hypothetical protein